MKTKINFKTIGLRLLALTGILLVVAIILNLLWANEFIESDFSEIGYLIGWSFNLGVICLLIANFSKIKYYYVNKFNRRFGYNAHSEKNDDNKKKGEAGEKAVAYELNHLDRSKSKTMHNFTIQAPNGDVVEIDHLVVSDIGIFHIETKAYEGSIQIDQYGSWIRTVNGNTIGEESPLTQVQKHHRTLVSLLGNKYPILPIVAIGNKRTIIQGRENFPYPILTLGTIQNYIENPITQGMTLTSTDRDTIIRSIQNAVIENKQF